MLSREQVCQREIGKLVLCLVVRAAFPTPPALQKNHNQLQVRAISGLKYIVALCGELGFNEVIEERALTCSLVLNNVPPVGIREMLIQVVRRSSHCVDPVDGSLDVIPQ